LQHLRKIVTDYPLCKRGCRAPARRGIWRSELSQKIKGSALIMALFIMALIAAAATALIYEQQLTIANTQQSFNYSQALQYNQMVTDWAADTLQQNLINPKTTHIDTIPSFYVTTTIPGGQYRGVLLDMRAKFNLNNLRTPANQAGFTNLLKTALPNLSNPQNITNAISNYLSPQGSYPSSYDDAYQKAKLPYTPPHRLLLNISELRKVIGITASLYQKLTPYLTVLPKTNTLLNINDASLETLTSLGPDVSLDTAKAIMNARPYKNSNDINKNPVISNHKLTNTVTVTSDFFVARSLVQIDKQQLLTNNYLMRDSIRKTTVVLYQTQGSSE